MKNLNINIDMKCDEEIVYYGFKNELEQVFLVILNNTKDAIKDNNIKDGKIDIIVDEFEDKLLIKIFDNAGGINPEILSRVFEPYFTTKHQDVGTGIGLYMSKMIIEESMGGNISLENQDRGVLTTIVLPKW